MPTPAPNASQLIERARAGSDSSLGRLLEGYREYLLRIATDQIDSDLRPKLPASDVVQGSMLIASREFPQFRGQTEPEFRNWLVRIMTNHLVDGLRRFLIAEKRRRGKEVPTGESVLKRIEGFDETPSRLVSLNEEATRLLEAMQSLPESHRAVIRGRYLEGLTFVELAERLKIPVTTCRRRWLEAVDSIGREMELDS
ncbi:MAG: sigma-70 family RNA polymerase sigma factor [Planctomycetaceae bacterium]|nr:sigma-70 family RNA polymerase sigma factor [Planctomycetaceae bacterium]